MKHWLGQALTFLVAFATPALAAGEGDAAAGKAVYTKRCGMCHGPAGEPKEAIAKMMKVEMRHLGSKEVQAKKDDELRTIIVKGKGKMKPVAGVTDKELATLVAYVRTLAKK
jgi:mono/diheme cytochrome c family protein